MADAKRKRNEKAALSKGWPFIFIGERMTAAEAVTKEKFLKSEPDDLASRLILIGYYGEHKSTTDALFQHLLWLVDHHPAHYICESWDYHARSIKWSASQKWTSERNA